MFWKKWPYWVRGAIIADGLVVLTNLYYYACIRSSDSDGEAIGCYISTLPVMFPEEIFPTSSEKAAMILVFFVWFLLGSLIGAIIGKFKKKPNVSQMPQV